MQTSPTTSSLLAPLRRRLAQIRALALPSALTLTLAVAAAAAPPEPTEPTGPTGPPPAPPAAATPAADPEERLQRIERELDAARAEIEALRRERSGAPAPAQAVAATGTATATATGTATATATGTATAGADQAPHDDRITLGPLELRAAFGKGVTISRTDGTFSLQIRGRIQVRFTEAIADGGVDGGADDSVTLFQVRRARLLFQGNVFTRDVTYYIQLGFSNLDNERDIESPLRDAWVNWAIWRDLQVKLGQMKVPFSRQRMTSSSALQFPDRTSIQGELNLDRDVGVILQSPDLGGMDGLLSYQAGVFGGEGRNRVSTHAGALLVGRFQVAPFGKFDDLVEADIERLDRPRLAIAAAAAWSENGTRNRVTTGPFYRASAVDTADSVHLAGDVLFKHSGLSLLSEVHYRDLSTPDVSGVVSGSFVSDPTRSGWGFFSQAGYMLTEHLEAAGRYGETRPLGSLTAVAPSHEVGSAVSWYFQGHDLKLQTGYAYFWGTHLSGGLHEIIVQAQLYF